MKASGSGSDAALPGDAATMHAPVQGRGVGFGRQSNRGLKRAFNGGRKALQGGGGVGQMRLGGAGGGGGFRHATRHRPFPWPFGCLAQVPSRGHVGGA